jgi:hypothetical protein
VLEEAVPAKLLHQGAASGIDVAMIHWEVGRCPFLSGLRDRAVAIVEERPAEE